MRVKPLPWDKPFAEQVAVDDLNAQIRRWADYLGLGSWEVQFSTAKCDDPAERASIDMDPQQRRAAIRLRSDVPVSQVDREIVHELLHALMSDMTVTFGTALEKMGPVETELYQHMWKQGAEFAIERLVNVLTGTTREDWPVGLSNDEVWSTAFPVGG